MKVLLLGATGLIGSAVAARLKQDGHELVGVTRRVDAAARRVRVDSWVALDLRTVEGPADWDPHLEGIEAVVNCAGTLQDSFRDGTTAVHDRGPRALWQACEKVGVRRVIQVSALGADYLAPTAFSKTKLAGDLALQATGLDWVILQPSIVVGRSAYGGSALFRAFASLPLTPRVDDTGPLDVVQLDDVAETVARQLTRGAASRVTMELAGPERLAFDQVVAAYRAWFGWQPARVMRVPHLLISSIWGLGDAVAWLGWRPPLRTTARREISRGSIGDNSVWRAETGIEPQSLGSALVSNPASVQERWFARLYLLKPLAFGVFVLFWLLTAVVTLGPGWERAVAVMRDTPAEPFAELIVILGSAADLLVAGLILLRRTARIGLIGAILLTLAYVSAATALRPDLWVDSLGPLMKLGPVLCLNLLLLAILDER